jgi:hypothetical protein
MTTAILIPTLNRPQRLRDLVANIRANTPEGMFTLLFCASDSASVGILENLGETVIDDTESGDHRYVTRMNRLVNIAMGLHDITSVFFGSDDVFHHEGWLPEALNALERHALVVVDDMRNQNGTQALARLDYATTAAVFDAQGIAFHPGYLHNFADTEQFRTAMANGEYGRALTSKVEHLHPLFGAPGSAEWDSTYRDAQLGWAHDEMLFLTRMQRLAAR